MFVDDPKNNSKWIRQKRSLAADENKQTKLTDFSRVQTMWRNPLSSSKPTLLHTGFTLKFLLLARQLPGATDPHLPWICQPQKNHTTIPVPSLHPFPCTHHCKMFHLCRPAPRPPRIYDLRAEQCGFSKETQFTFIKQEVDTFQPKKKKNEQHFNLLPARDFCDSSGGGVKERWDGDLLALTHTISYLALFV